MSDSFPCRLLIDSPGSGAWNMAVDEALLSDAAGSNMAAVRFYEWQEPTLSLGYFQRYGDRTQHAASLSVDCVRRQSGGGAILHHRELTYSICLPPSHPLSRDAYSLYRTVHEVIAAALRKNLPEGSRWSVQFAEDQPAKEDMAEPFLCFQRRTSGDLIVTDGRAGADHKVVGSAQRRSRGAVLQHGSVLLAKSSAAPELAGINDVCDTRYTTTCLVSELSLQLADVLGLAIHTRALDDKCSREASRLELSKYRNRLWLERR